MKQCGTCKKFKELNTFVKNCNTKDGTNSICKVCHKKAQAEYRKKYPWKQTLLRIKKRCNNPKCKDYPRYGGRGIKCLITEEELEFLWNRDKAWLLEKPSIDRKNNDGNYTLDNCRYIEMVINAIKSSIKPILQYDLNGNFIREWKSIKEACLFFNTAISNLSCCLTGRSKTCRGYLWSYKNEKICYNK